MATLNKDSILSLDKLEKAFKMFDKDGSGTLSLSEIKKIFKGAGNVEDNVWQQLLWQANINSEEITF